MAHTSPHQWTSPAYVAEWVAERSLEDSQREHHFRLMAELLPLAPNQDARIVDIGAGYGPLTKVLLDAFPGATVIAQDYSQAMLDEAARRLARYGKRVQFVKANLLRPDWIDGLGKVDAMVSSMCLHNLGRPDRVREIYQEAFAALSPGGAFLDVDIVNGSDPATHWLNMSGILKEDRERGASTRSLIEGTWQPLTGYRFPATVEEKLVWLRQSGFAVVDCWWKEMGRALVGGLKMR